MILDCKKNIWKRNKEVWIKFHKPSTLKIKLFNTLLLLLNLISIHWLLKTPPWSLLQWILIIKPHQVLSNHKLLIGRHPIILRHPTCYQPLRKPGSDLIPSSSQSLPFTVSSLPTLVAQRLDSAVQQKNHWQLLFKYYGN